METIFFESLFLLLLFQIKNLFCDGFFKKHIFGFFGNSKNLLHPISHGLATASIVFGFLILKSGFNWDWVYPSIATFLLDVSFISTISHLQIMLSYHPLSPIEYHDLLIFEGKHGTFEEGDSDKKNDTKYRWFLVLTQYSHQMLYYFIIFGMLKVVNQINL